ncbi:MAG TPA: hypothetical protein VJC03_09505, partial [bacterium]|nr:hypothetical protein [bacterium]
MLILILLTILPLFVQAEEQRPTISDIDYIGLLGEKNNLEKKLEDYVNTVLDRMMGPEKASCVISITPEVEKSKIETETWAKQESKGSEQGAAPPKPTEFLPGIPLKKDLVEKESPVQKEAAQSGMKKSIESIIKVPTSFIKNIRATLIIDKSIPDDMVSAARDVVIDMLDIQPERGDKLIIRRVKFSPFKKLLHFFTDPKSWLYILAGSLILLFLLFLFGPLRRFLFALLQTMKELKGIESEAGAAGGGGGGGGAGKGEGEYTIKEEGGEDEVPLEDMIEEAAGEEGFEGRLGAGLIIEEKQKFIETLPLPEEEVGKMLFRPFQWVKNEDLKKLGFL